MKRKNIITNFLAVIVSVLLISPIMTQASDTLQSKGRIEYNNPNNTDESIILDASDHTYLKNGIDANTVEITSLKEYIANQNSINTEVKVDLTTINEKLDYLIANGMGGGNIAGTSELVLLGIGTSFNISELVGAENVGNYSINDFICVPNDTNTLTYNSDSYWGVNDIQTYYNMKYIPVSDFQLIYDNSNGNVTITEKTIRIEVNAKNTHSATFTILPKVYLIKKQHAVNDCIFTKVAEDIRVTMVNGSTQVASDLPEAKSYLCVVEVVSGNGAFGTFKFSSGTAYVGTAFQTIDGQAYAPGSTFTVGVDGYGTLSLSTDSRFAGTVVDVDIYAIP